MMKMMNNKINKVKIILKKQKEILFNNKIKKHKLYNKMNKMRK